MVLHLECGHSSCCVCLCEDSKRVSTLAGSTLWSMSSCSTMTLPSSAALGGLHRGVCCLHTSAYPAARQSCSSRANLQLLGTRYLNIDIGLEIDIDRSSKPTAALKRCGKNTSHKSGDVKGIMGQK